MSLFAVVRKSFLFFMVVASLMAAALPSIVSAAPATGTIQGTVTDAAGAPLANATVMLSGVNVRQTQSDIEGHFVLYDVFFGSYTLSVTKAGFKTQRQPGFTVQAPETQISVTLVPEQIEARLLGRITVTSAHQVFNTSPAAMTVVSPQTFQDQAQFDVRRVLEEIPTVSLSPLYGLSSHSVFLAIQESLNVQIRGGFAYESATTFDGHELPPTADFLNSGFDQSLFTVVGLKEIDTIRGPGALSPTINSAVNGSVAYVSASTPSAPTGSWDITSDGYGGSMLNLSYGNQLPGGKIKYFFGYGAENSPGPFGTGAPQYLFTFPGFDTYMIGGKVYTITPCTSGAPGCTVYDLPGQTIYGPKSFLHTLVSKGSHLMVCCDIQKSLNNKWSSFGKLSYQISPSTSLSFMAMSTHSILDPGNIAGGGYIEQFAPPAGYTGSLPAGNYDGFGSYGLAQYNSAAQNANEVELKTSVGRGLVRLSYLSLTQLSDWYAGPGPLLRNTPVTLYGYLALTDVNTHINTVQIANGLQAQLVNDFRYDYLSTEGRWRGWTAEYDLPIGGNLYTLAVDSTALNSIQGASYGFGPLSGFVFASSYPDQFGGQLKEVQDSALVRASFNPLPNVAAVTSGYFNRYSYHVSPLSPTNPTVGIDPTYVPSFVWEHNYYDSPRLALTWRPTNDVSWRFSAGGSIVPVPLAAKNTAGSPPMLNSAGTAYFATGSGADLRPETSFGYDFGVDRRLNGAGIIVSTDTWLTNLFGQYFTSTVQSGTFAGLPLYINAPRNLNRSRYYGVEATIQSIAKPIGPFFTVSGALMRAYTYDLPAHFYDTPVVDAKGNTTWTPFTSNLAIIPGLNFRGGYYVGGAGNGSEAIPYSNGSASAGYRFAHNSMFTLYATYYGPNNGYYKPAFVTLSTDLRVPLTERTSAQFTVDNLTNKYPGVYQYLFDQEGVGIPLADGTLGQAPTEGLGPRTLRIGLQQRL